MIGLSYRGLSRRVPPVPPALLIVCLAATAAACTTTPPDAGDRLRGGFPQYAAEVLERGSKLSQTARGFEVIGTEIGPVQSKGTVVLPSSGGEAIVFAPRNHPEVRVREVGLTGHGRIVDRSVTYRAPGVTSYWSAGTGGAEEWLLFEPGAVTAGRAAAIWEVAGATPVQRGEAVAIYSEKGRRLLTVEAPAAFFADGTDAPVHLSVRGATIELFVESGGRGVLVDPSWTYVSSMNEARLGHTAARLTSGNVLVAGGESDFFNNPPSAVGQPSSAFASYSAEIYDPVFDGWSYLPDMFQTHREHAMVTQPGIDPPNGGVFVIAGRNDFGDFLSQTEMFDGQQWQFMPYLDEERAAHTATRLSDDRVLVAGGYNDCGGGSGQAEALAMSPGGGSVIGSGYCFLCTAEVYDPTAGSGSGDWIGTGDLNFCRALHTETILTNGTVLVAGGETDLGPLNTAEIWSAALGQWTQVASMAKEREHHTATRLPDGKVLVTGGISYDGTEDSAELYDPATDTWTPVGDMQIARERHAAVLMNDGTVLITGGYEFGDATYTSEIYDPATQQFTFTVDMNEHRAQHTETLLADGNVLVTGGDDYFGDPPITSSAEIFSFIGQLGQPCGVGTDCQSGFCVDGVCCNSICDQPCEACTNNAKSENSDVEVKFSNGFGGSGSGSGGDGYCGPVYYGEDPADECADEDQSSCGTIGHCDGFGSCEIYSAETPCQFPDCDGTIAQGGGLCDGNGTCVTEPSGECAPYLCNEGVCETSCADQPDCSPFAFCDGIIETCTAKKKDGEVAFDPVQCMSGITADGVCCDTPCDQACESCSVQTGASEDGTCSPVSGFTCDDGNACTQIDTCQTGVCVGAIPVECPGDVGCQGGLACDVESGECTVAKPPKNVGDACNDGLTCTTADVCTAGGGCAGTAVMCSPGECQSAATCNEGVGCTFTSEPDYTQCTKDTNPCTIEWCLTGACIANNVTDLSPCPGGVCIGGACIPDGALTGGGPGGGGVGASSQGGEGGAGAQGAGGNDPAGGGGAGGEGTGANSAANGNQPAFKLQGAGCSTAPADSTPSSGWAAAALALLGLFGARRRRDTPRS